MLNDLKVFFFSFFAFGFILLIIITGVVVMNEPKDQGTTTRVEPVEEKDEVTLNDLSPFARKIVYLIKPIVVPPPNPTPTPTPDPEPEPDPITQPEPQPVPDPEPEPQPIVDPCSSTHDTDADLLSDEWESKYNLDSTKKDSNNNGFPDADEDLDDDGFNNLQEFTACTNPTDATSHSSNATPGFVFTFLGSYVDGLTLRDEGTWEAYKETLLDLRDIGITHAGVKIWSNDLLPELTSTRLSELRQLGFNLALEHTPGRFLNDKNVLDSGQHGSNQQDLKYFGASGFNPLSCSASCDCSNGPNRRANDPGYNGRVWQNELSLLSGILSLAHLSSQDLLMIDLEIWGPEKSDITNCYPKALDDGGRYTGSPSNRIAEYYLNWRSRSDDLRDVAKSGAPSTKLSFYNDTPNGFLSPLGASVPAGLGGIKSRPFYHLPNLNAIRLNIEAEDFSNSYAWMSLTRADRPIPPRNVVWEAGKILKENGIKGILLWPGPVLTQLPDGSYAKDQEYITLAKDLYQGYRGQPFEE